VTSVVGLVATALAAFAASYTGVAAVRAVATRRDWLDYPNSRSSHAVVTPRGGGLAVVVVCVVGLTIALLRASLLTRDWKIVLIVASAVAAVSWIDDLWTLSSTIRISVHITAAVITVAGVGMSFPIDSWGSTALATVAATVTMLWVVGLTNAYNFMDGIDLMAAGQAIAGGGGWAVLGALAGSRDLLLLGVIVSFAAAGFALHNWPPARIFMGDVGSAFLGYLLAATAVVGVHRNSLLGLCGVLVVWPFVFDTMFTFMRRLKNREPVFKAHRSHLYQRLVIAGMTHLQVSLLYFVLELMGVACAIALMMAVPHALPMTMVTITASAYGLWAFVMKREKRSRGVT
jgi:Fuc2NAc and GlcNAc transferase